MLFDTHAHLVDPQLAPQLSELLEQASAAGLVGITAVGTTVEDSQACVELAAQQPLVHAAVGIHPNECRMSDQQQWDQIVELAGRNEVVAIGETGLDRYWDACPIETQREWFARHLELSFETGKPLVIHMRDCESDIVDMLNRHQRDGRINGILHSFTGRWETAISCLDLGMYISFAGMVTFRKSGDLRDVAREIPDDRILIETDSPYLSPHPMRGTRPNQPALVQHTAACLASVRGVTVEEFSRQTTGNAFAVFQLPARP